MHCAIGRTLLVTVALMVLVACQSHHQADSSIAIVQNGTLDLQHQALPAPIWLNGYWKFYWKQFIDPSDSASNTFELAPVPGSWTELGHAGSGYASYRLTILHPPPDLALTLVHARACYELFVNGKRMASVGTVDSAESLARGVYRPIIVPLAGQGERIDLVWHVANYLHRSGGLTNAVTIGPLAPLVEQRNNAIAFDAFIVGALLLFGFYHLALYALHRDLTALWFMGCYLFLALRIMTRQSLLLMNLFPNLNAELLLRLEYAGVFGISFFTLAHMRLFPQIVPRIPALLYVSCNTVLLVLGFCLPAPQFTYLAIFWEASAALGVVLFLIFALNSVRAKAADSRIYLTAYTLICASIVNETLHGAGVIHTFPSIIMTAFAVLALQSILLSHTFVQAVAHVRQATGELEMRRQQERELRRTQLRLQGMLDRLTDAVAATNEDGLLIYGNHAFFGTYGTKETLVNKPITTLFPDMQNYGPHTGNHGETITRSELDMGDELLWLYLVSWPDKASEAASAQDLVDHLRLQSQRLQKIALQLQRPEHAPIAQELGRIGTSLATSSLASSDDRNARKRHFAPPLLQDALAYWQELTGKDKFAFAQESRLWNVEISPDGWTRTRTLDKYLAVETLPRHPRWNQVVESVEYVLSESDRELPQRQSLLYRLEEFRNL